MERYRIRFLLQELDLVGPEVVIGRSPDCQITIEDPLVSRQHARIKLAESGASVEDLGSRNGVRVNGRLIEAPTVLRDGDRIRIGTQELVITQVRLRDQPVRATGFLRVCRACGAPYPEVSPTCPHCGAITTPDEETMSGLKVEPKRSWTFELLGEVIERALATSRAIEAERLVRRAAKEVDERIAEGERLDPAHVALVGGFAIRLAKLLGGTEWVAWSLTLHRQQGLMLSTAVIDRLLEADLAAAPDSRALVVTYLEWFKASHGELARPDLAGLARLEQLLAK